MFNRRGFSLIEAVVAILIGAVVVVAVGGLSERLVHHRTTTDSNSAAMTLAEKQMEKLLADPVSDPTSCPTPPLITSPALCAGTHPAITLNANATASGPYRLQWVVADSGPTASFFKTLTVRAVKQLTVTVTLPNNPYVNASIVTFYEAG
jgi:prepilin-type N-terminal cleavage/methylation domain-containing protein